MRAVERRDDGHACARVRWFVRAHSLKALERSTLGFVGIAPIHETLIGSIESLEPAERDAWLRKAEALGQRGA